MLCIAFLYKKLVEYLDGFKNISYGLVVCLINIDRVKLIYVNMVAYVYICLFDLLDEAGVLEMQRDDNAHLTVKGKLSLGVVWVIKTFLINPWLALLHKFYYLLYI